MKIITLSTLLFAISFSLNAQFAIAPIAGLNISDLKTVNTAVFETSPVMRHYVGIQPRWAFSEKFNAGMGLQYATKGFIYGAINSKYETAWKTQYIDFMPFAEYKPLSTLGLYAGGYFGLLLDEKFNSDNKWTTPKYGYVDNTDVGGIIGVRLYAKNAFFNLSYSRSIVPVSETNYTDESGETIENVKQFNQALSLGAGYYFQFEKK